MKISFLLMLLVIFVICLSTEADPKPFFDKLFNLGGSDGYSNGYYPYPSRPRSYGRNYEHAESGADRYRSICRVHAVDTLAFPGNVGRPICP